MPPRHEGLPMGGPFAFQAIAPQIPDSQRLADPHSQARRWSVRVYKFRAPHQFLMCADMIRFQGRSDSTCGRPGFPPGPLPALSGLFFKDFGCAGHIYTCRWTAT